MPFFTVRDPETERRGPPRKEDKKGLSVVTMSSNKETTLLTQTTTTQIEGKRSSKSARNTTTQQARIDAVNEQHRNGTYVVSFGMQISVDMEGNECLHFPLSHRFANFLPATGPALRRVPLSAADEKLLVEPTEAEMKSAEHLPYASKFVRGMSVPVIVHSIGNALCHVSLKPTPN
jgi:hypothetical protein